LRDTFPGDEHVEDGRLLDVVDGLLVGHHREVVAVQLQDLVVDAQTCSSGCAVFCNISHVDSIVRISLGTFSVVLVDTSTDLKSAPDLVQPPCEELLESTNIL